MLITKQPTSFTSPDPAQGGSGIASATNTGHGNAIVAAGGVETRSCLWTGLQSVAGQIKSITLKADWSYINAAVDGGGNVFRCEYSLNGGSTWTNALFEHLNVNGANSGSSQANLSAGQDVSQIQVRDLLQASGGTADLTGSISNIRVEVETVDAQVIVMW